MGLRVTQNMLMSWAQRDIRNNALSLGVYREQLSTGKRINRPSDDPSAFLRILPLKNDIDDIRRFIENADIADDSITTASSSLEEVSGLMAEAKRLAIQGANGTLSTSDRANIGTAIDQLLNQVLGIANSKLGDRYLFGGTASTSRAFELVEDGKLSFVRYLGTEQEVSMGIAPGAETVITSSGREIFQASKRGPTSFIGTNGVQAGTGTDSGTGRGRLRTEFTGLAGLPAGIAAGSTTPTGLGVLNYTIDTTGASPTISINGGPTTTFDGTGTDVAVPVGDTGKAVFLDLSGYGGGNASGSFTSEGRMTWDEGKTWTPIDFSAVNQQLTNAATGEVLNVDSTGINGTGLTELRFSGTFDVFSSLIRLRDLLTDSDGLGPAEVTQRITSLIGDLDQATDKILESLRTVGARGSQLELTRGRMTSLELTMRESLSREEDVDIAETILNMTKADTSYQASLQVGARVIQRTLLDFLR